MHPMSTGVVAAIPKQKESVFAEAGTATNWHLQGYFHHLEIQPDDMAYVYANDLTSNKSVMTRQPPGQWEELPGKNLPN